VVEELVEPQGPSGNLLHGPYRTVHGDEKSFPDRVDRP
jgi:hypothetical protein